ncbi:MAG: ABC transporter permease [Actinobacteria bacterium]|nr:ABC transporter permease [Actinomycetota bacterium]
MRALLHKELRELIKTARLAILPVVFVILGITGPALIRLLPILLENAQTEGIDMTLPEFGPADAFASYLEMVRQMGLLAVILVFMGFVAGERRNGMLASLFVKPVSRLEYVVTRWAVNGVYVMASLFVGSAVALAYTFLLFAPIDVGAVARVTLLYASYVLLVFSWTVFLSSLFVHPAAAGGLSVIPLFVLPALGLLWGPLGDYGPYGAVAGGTATIGAAGSPAEALGSEPLISAALNLGLCVALVAGTYLRLRRMEL